MEPSKRKRLEEAGYQIGDAEDFLALTVQERQLVELRVALGKAVRLRRRRRNLSQAALARLLGSTQARVAKIEAAASDVSLDLMFRGLFAAGGSPRDLEPFQTPETPKRTSPTRRETPKPRRSTPRTQKT
jgi:hypothetical protein